MVLKQKISLEEFLELPDSEPSLEFVDGDVVEKEVPKFKHGLIQYHLAKLIGQPSVEAAYRIVTEVRFIFGARQRVYIPDISVVKRDRVQKVESGEVAEDQNIAPDIAIEILSPGQSAGRLLEKLTYYMENGILLALVIDVEQRHVVVNRPGENPQMVEAPAVLTLAPVIPGLQIDLDSLFAELK